MTGSAVVQTSGTELASGAPRVGLAGDAGTAWAVAQAVSTTNAPNGPRNRKP
jgi:hypothetical protein